MPASEFSDVFVSYRRVDVEFVKQLVEDLQNEGKEVWIDWEDIPPGAEGFADEIKRGLEGADTFLCVLSPDYLQSSYCVDLELAYAVSLKKKIIPVVLKKFDDHPIPDGISHINWIYFTPHAGQDNGYQDAFPRILDVLHTDLEHVRQHKRFLIRAIEWDNNKRQYSFLLNGEEIDQAQDWLAHSAGKEPIPTDLHKDYITASTQFKRRQQRLLLTGVSIALIISIALAFLSLLGFNNASIAQAEAESNEALAHTAQVKAEDSADIAQTAQANAEANEAIAEQARDEAERNLRDARQSQSLFHGDLAQQQAEQNLYQRALLLGLEALKFHAEGITSDSAYMAVHEALHQPVRRTLHVEFPMGLANVIWSDDSQQAMLVTDNNDFMTCPEIADCTPRAEIWDIATRTRLAYLPHEAPVTSALWNQADQQALTLSYDEATNQSMIILWDIENESEIYRLSFDHYLDWIVWQPGSAYFIGAGQSQFSCGFGNEPECNRQAVVYEYATGTAVMSAPHEREIVNARLSPDNLFLEIVVRDAFDNIPVIYNFATGELVAVYDKTYNRGVIWQDDDNHIIAAKDGAIISQSLDTGDILYSISSTTPFTKIDDVIVIPVSQTCVTYDFCQELQVYDANTGDLRFTTSHDEATQDIYLSTVLQDGKYLLTETRDVPEECPSCATALYLWSLDSGELVHTFDYEGWITYLGGGYDWNADETRLLTHSLNDIEHHIVELWDIETGEKLLALDLDRDSIDSVKFDSSSSHLVVNRGKTVEFYDVATGKKQHTLSHPAYLDDVKVFSDARQIVTHTSNDFTIWEVVDWGATLRNPTGFEINGEVYNEERTQLLTWSGTDRNTSLTPNAYVWDVETGKLLLTLETDVTVTDGLWSPDRKRIVLSQSQKLCEEDCISGIIVFDANTGQPLGTYDNIGGYGFLWWYPDTNHLINNRYDHLIILDVATGEVVYQSDQYTPGLTEWNSDYTLFVNQNTVDNSVPIVRYPTNEILHTIPLSSPVYDIHWVDGDQIVTFLVDSADQIATDVVAFDVTSAEELYRVPNAGIYEDSHDSSRLAIIDGENQLRYVDATNGDILWSASTLDEQWTDIIWSPDDTKLIIAGFYAGRSQLFDAETGDLLNTFQFNQLAWSPDSRMILLYDDNVNPAIWRVYDIEADEIRFSFVSDSRVRWGRDSKNLVSHDGRWSADIAELINRGENWRIRELTELELQEFFIKPPPDRPEDLLEPSDTGEVNDDTDD